MVSNPKAPNPKGLKPFAAFFGHRLNIAGRGGLKRLSRDERCELMKSCGEEWRASAELREAWAYIAKSTYDDDGGGVPRPPAAMQEARASPPKRRRV